MVARLQHDIRAGRPYSEALRNFHRNRSPRQIVEFMTRAAGSCMIMTLADNSVKSLSLRKRRPAEYRL